MESRPLYRVGAAGLDPRDWRLIEIVFKHSQYNRYEFSLVPDLSPDAIDILIVNTLDPAGVRAVSAVRNSGRVIPVVVAVPRGSPSSARHAISIDRLTLQLLPILNRVVDQELSQGDLHMTAAAGTPAAGDAPPAARAQPLPPSPPAARPTAPAATQAPAASSSRYAAPAPRGDSWSDVPPGALLRKPDLGASTPPFFAATPVPLEPSRAAAAAPSSAAVAPPAAAVPSAAAAPRTTAAPQWLPPSQASSATPMPGPANSTFAPANPTSAPDNAMSAPYNSASSPAAGPSQSADRAPAALPARPEDIPTLSPSIDSGSQTYGPPTAMPASISLRGTGESASASFEGYAVPGQSSQPASGAAPTAPAKDRFEARIAPLPPAAPMQSTSAAPQLPSSRPSTPFGVATSQPSQAQPATERVEAQGARPARTDAPRSNLVAFPGAVVEPPLPRLKALIIDDSPTVRQQLSGAFERMGIRCQTASSAAAALQKLAAEHFDLALVDIVMPDMDGYKLTREIKRNKAWRQMPVIILTSKTSPFDLARGALAGCDSYLSKPVPLRALEAAVVKQLRKSLAIDDLSDLLKLGTQAAPPALKPERQDDDSNGGGSSTRSATRW